MKGCTRVKPSPCTGLAFTMTLLDLLWIDTLTMFATSAKRFDSQDLFCRLQYKYRNINILMKKCLFRLMFLVVNEWIFNSTTQQNAIDRWWEKYNRGTLFQVRKQNNVVWGAAEQIFKFISCIHVHIFQCGTSPPPTEGGSECDLLIFLQAYFGGEARCDAEAGQGDDYDPSELICGACSDVSRAQVNKKNSENFHIEVSTCTVHWGWRAAVKKLVLRKFLNFLFTFADVLQTWNGLPWVQMPLLLLCRCVFLLWDHTFLQCLSWWLPENDQYPQRRAASLSCW